MNTDLTVGKPWKVLLKYILPLFGSAVFQQLYTLADTIIAGRFAGQTALTAIGASNAIVNILMAVSLGANAGCAVLVSRYFGARQNGRTKTTIYTALISFAILSVLLATAGVATCRLILTALKTPQEALSESIDYLNIYYFGLPFLMLYNLGTGIFSALGDSRTPFIFLVFSSVANIVLDYFMVQDSGVRGVAWATFIAQGVACVLTLIFVFLRGQIQIGRKQKGLFFRLAQTFAAAFSSDSFAKQLCVRRQSDFAGAHKRACASARHRHYVGFYRRQQACRFLHHVHMHLRKRSYEFRVAELRRAQVQTDKAGLRLVACHFFRYCFAVCRGVSYFYRAAYKFVYGTGRGR